MTAAQRRGALVAAVVAGYVAALLFVVDPFGGPDLCPLHRFTGLDCPGCGTTRASWLLLRGDLAGAVRHNVLLLPTLAVLALHAVRRLPPRVLVAAGYAALAFGVVRNLPAFDVLRPPAPSELGMVVGPSGS